MKKIVLILILLTIGTIGFLVLNKQYALTYYKIPLFSVPNGQVRIDFVNKSNENIKSISLFPSTAKVENIKVGERRTVTIEHAGEGTYQFIVNFDSGKQINEGERYVEGGYFLTENIYNNEVKTDY
ncbi:hypothetical protein [Crocinitomix catalasitica]|uniref:hypothetical protein n=1 Tax=Crocinitomix catalasitica TaxID=184607 RepID=UPI000481A7AE|nr:hypothetical protein [Crocinitomix catalasitica]